LLKQQQRTLTATYDMFVTKEFVSLPLLYSNKVDKNTKPKMADKIKSQDNFMLQKTWFWLWKNSFL